MFNIDFLNTEHHFNASFNKKNNGFGVNFDSTKEIIIQDVIPLPENGNPGDFLCRSDEQEVSLKWVPLADHAEQDNNAPISAAAVYTEIGNINVLLATI